MSGLGQETATTAVRESVGTSLQIRIISIEVRWTWSRSDRRFGMAPKELRRASHASRNEPALWPDKIHVPDAAYEPVEDCHDLWMGEFTDERHVGEKADADAGQDPGADRLDAVAEGSIRTTKDQFLP